MLNAHKTCFLNIIYFIHVVLNEPEFKAVNQINYSIYRHTFKTALPGIATCFYKVEGVFRAGICILDLQKILN